MKTRVLCLLVNGFEEIEAVTPIDLLRRADVEVITAALGEKWITGRSGIRIEADTFLNDVTIEDFDLLLLPGGPAVQEMRRDCRVVELAQRFHEEGKTLAAICAAPLVLHDAGLLTGRKFTAHSSTRDELPTAEDARLVVDGKLITSRGAGTALEFGLALVAHLLGDEAARKVSSAIMA